MIEHGINGEKEADLVDKDELLANEEAHAAQAEQVLKPKHQTVHFDEKKIQVEEKCTSSWQILQKNFCWYIAFPFERALEYLESLQICGVKRFAFNS